MEIRPQYDISGGGGGSGGGRGGKTLGTYLLVADGVSKFYPSLGNPNQSVSQVAWSIYGTNGTLGCTVDANGVVTAGKQTGTIFLQAMTPWSGSGSPPCDYNNGAGDPNNRIQIDLICCPKDDEVACATCDGGFSGASGANSSVDVAFGLGWSALSGTAGRLSINADYPDASLATPKALRYNYVRPDVAVIRDGNGNLRQVNAPEGLADIVTNSATSYFINLYSPTNILGTTNGLYFTAGNPLVTMTVESPGGDTNHLRVTQTRQGTDTIFDYQWAGTGWQLATGGGLRQETKTTVWSQSNTVRTVTQVVRNADGSVAKNGVETYQQFPTGEHLIQQIIGAGANAQTNTYNYSTNGYLQQSVLANGSWQYFVYDDRNRPTNVFSSFGNQAFTTNPALCKLMVYDYSPNDVSGSGDDGHLGLAVPRLTIQYLQGQEIARNYAVVLPSEQHDIQCVTAGAVWNDTNNLVTITKLYGDGIPHELELYSVQQPDGTVEIHLYGNGYASTTNVTLNGHPDGSGANIDQGTRTVDVIGPAGQLLSRTVYDVPTGVMLSSDSYAYDDFKRLTTTTHSDGTYEQNIYDCCTLNSKRNRDGSYTYYAYDSLKRLVATTYNGITVSNVLDAEGNLLATVRYGTDGTAITNQTSTFDISDFQTSSQDALGNLTTYTNYIDASGQTIKQTTYPDLSTRIETYALDGSLLKVGGTAVHPVRYVYGVEDDGSGVQRAFTKTIPLNTDGTDSQEWTKTYTDMAGRACKTLYADNAASFAYYNQQGQAAETVDPDGITQLYLYNNLGQPAYSAIDMDQNGTIDFAGTDRITFTTNDVITDHGTYVKRTQTFEWTINGSDSPLLTDTTEQSVDGLTTWDIRYGLTNFTQTSYLGNGLQVVTQITPNGCQTTSTNLNGQLISVTRYDSLNNQLSSLNYGYDAYGRQSTVTDARNGTTISFFNNADQVVSTLTPSPDGVKNGQVTTNVLDSMGRVIQTILPDNTSVTNVYYPNGLRQETSGSRNYPVAYTYDYAGRMKTMQTWKSFAGGTGAATTTWTYDSLRGWLTSKQYDNGKGPAYTNTPAGRLQSRTWARTIAGQPLVTTYSYDNAGTLAGINYSDGTTPNVSYTFDRRGRLTQVADVGTRTLSCNDAGEVLNDNYLVSGLGLGSQLQYGYDGLLRRTNLNNTSLGANVNYSYDTASRLVNVSDGANMATYNYLTNSPLVGQILFTNNGTLRMTTTKSYDFLNRLTGIQSSAGVSPATSSAYQYNAANQRTNQLREDGTYWVYQYDSLGQVTSGKKYWSDGTAVAGQQFEYAFDDIGNRTQTKSGGDQSGAGLRPASYNVNSLNQITSRDVPGYIEDQGSASSNATVTINGAVAYQRGNYYRGELAVNNGSAPIYLAITNQGTLDTNSVFINRHALVAQTPETLGYDADGNLTNDGKWSYTWNGENRLTAIQSLTTIPAAARRQMQYAYDDQGRRIYAKIMEWNTNSSSYTLITEERYWYDGWNIIGRADVATTLVQNFVWGLDLSGTMQGAGGVGGLLMLNDSTGASYLYNYDGNGNVLALINANDGTTAAQYDYDPFLGVIRADGLMAKPNPFLGSTKFYDWETGLYYYGYRYYDPSTGKWPNRDPIEELGFELLRYGDIRDEIGRSTPYTFVVNNPISAIDFLGLKLGDVPGEIPFPPYNPPDAGKPCCCSPSSVVTGTRNDWNPLLDWSILGIWDRWLLTLGVELHVSGNPDCFKDIEVQWARCWGVGGAGYMGSGTSVQVYVDTQLGIGVSWTTVAKINYLTYKGGVWTKEFSKASRPYNWTGWGWNFQ